MDDAGGAIIILDEKNGQVSDTLQQSNNIMDGLGELELNLDLTTSSYKETEPDKQTVPGTNNDTITMDEDRILADPGLEQQQKQQASIDKRFSKSFRSLQEKLNEMEVSLTILVFSNCFSFAFQVNYI